MSSQWDNLKTLRDELALQVNLMEKEVRDSWELLSEKVETLEHKLVQIGAELGQAESEWVVGEEEDIEQLIMELEALRDRHTPANKE